MNILELPRREFIAMLPELAQQGVDTDALLRQYRSANSPLAGVNQAAEAARSGITDEGRRGVAGGLLSKDVGTTGMDALRSLRVEPMAGLLGMLSGAGQAVEAPSAAARGLIPVDDVALEALGTAGMAMAGGGAAVAPRGSLRANALRGGGTSDPTQTGWTFRDVDASLNSQLSGAENRRVGGDTSRVENVPIRRLSAMQETVNPDFATATSSAGELPLVVRKNGQMFVRDGHHRLTAAAEGGSQNANVRFIDLDNADTSTPLLDWSPEKTGFVEADQALLDELFSANANTSGGLLATAASDALTPPQQMARRILDMRAAGRARDVTDDMMAQADPQYMYNNTPLPMDEASRLARAGDAGFDTDQRYYHGSAAEDQIDRFDMAYAGSASQQPDERAIFTTQNPDVASFFANYAHPVGERMPFGGAGEGQVLPVTSRGSVKGIDWMGQPYNGERMVRDLNYSSSNGFDRVAISGMRENLDGFDPIDKQAAVFNPANIRSRFARFDPEFAHLSNLSAANASPTAGLLGVSAVQEDKKELPFMNFMRGLLQ